MFYQPKNGHGLSHNPFSAIISPRPIAWISTQSRDGVANLAPYSFFNAVAYEPPQVMFASVGRKADQVDTKDTLANIRETGEFCINIVEFDQRLVMNGSSAPFAKEVDEFENMAVEKASCQMIACPRVASAPASLECVVTHIEQIRGEGNFVVFGEVVGIHLRDNCVVDGIFDVTLYKPMARLGYRDYAVVEQTISLDRPEE